MWGHPCRNQGGASSSYASATGSPTSYARVHGEVSRAPANWERIPNVYKELLEEVKYDKAEGIAKVSSLELRACLAALALQVAAGAATATSQGKGCTMCRARCTAQITINRPHKRNAFTPRTVHEMSLCFTDARDDPAIGAVILTGEGPLAFCSGGDQSVRGDGGYVGADGIPRLNVLDLQMQIRRLPKPVLAAVAGYAVGGGHVLHMMCDITVAADNAVFGQTGPKVGSFDAGYGSTQMVRLVGQKRAREMWFLARLYDARTALAWGLVNAVVPLAELETEAVAWCREMLRNSPTALRLLKSALNAAEDGQAGIQQLGGDATLLFYQSAEGSEGRRAFLEKRAPDFSQFRRLP